MPFTNDGPYSNFYVVDNNSGDRGWEVVSTELFSETVTTVEEDGVYGAQLAYSDTIDADTIIVTFDGTEYTCQRIDAFGEHYYGGFTKQEGPTFTEFPFFIESNSNTNTFGTQTAGTHTIAVAALTLQISADFSKALSTVIGGAFYPVTSGVTTWQQVADAMGAGKVAFRSYFEENDDYGEFLLITNVCIDTQSRYAVYGVVARESGLTAISATATTADSPLSF